MTPPNPPEFYATCECGIKFFRQSAHTYHIRHCPLKTGDLANNLSLMQDAKKRRKTEDAAAAAVAAAAQVVAQAAAQVAAQGAAQAAMKAAADAAAAEIEAAAAVMAGVPLAQRRSRRQQRLPKRFADLVPSGPSALPAHMISLQPESTARSPSLLQEPSQPRSPIRTASHEVLDTVPNKFGLFRRYESAQLPSHDPEGDVPLEDLMENQHNAAPTFSPYPNASSFRLAEWQWLHGGKKSRASFDALTALVGHPEFKPEDVRSTDWRGIEAILAKGNMDSSVDDGQGPARDGPRPGQWQRRDIKFTVPFHSKMKHPGNITYTAGELEHRSLTSIIRDRITNPDIHPHLHFQPYELYWRPEPEAEPVRVHGELYTSDAFVAAHRELQQTPREPDCTLERVVVGMMFASDATHLTSFGDAKLWPLYVALGNESKYRRGEPSNQCFEHAAYFQSVGLDSFIVMRSGLNICACTVTGHVQGLRNQ